MKLLFCSQQETRLGCWKSQGGNVPLSLLLYKAIDVTWVMVCHSFGNVPLSLLLYKHLRHLGHGLPFLRQRAAVCCWTNHRSLVVYSFGNVPLSLLLDKYIVTWVTVCHSFGNVPLSLLLDKSITTSLSWFAIPSATCR